MYRRPYLQVYGHSHCYERYFPVLNLTVRPGLVEAGAHGVYWDPEGTIHVTSGAGGNSEMKRGKDPPPAGPCNDTSPWCAFQSGFAPQGQQVSALDRLPAPCISPSLLTPHALGYFQCGVLPLPCSILERRLKCHG